ncbi:RpnC/YadD family protein [Streptomyces sasae]|uniref:hypothetical protein n=1 Tax=Streptomyces sasae TaxID=1266772 RepID=UPI002930F62D|nr:hypothetical protein [Streptomyces sasae]
MVSSPHEAMHRIFQQDPGLFARAARSIGVPFADPVASTLLPTDLTENHPLERRVDSLMRVDTAEQGSYLLVVEAQGKKDPDKPASWTYYLSYLYAKYRLPPVLVVVCQDRATATWAARHLEIGPPQWPSLTLRPLVLGPDNVPLVTSPDKVAHDLPMAVLSAVLHHRDPQIEAILKAMAPVLRDLQEHDEDTADIYIELTQQGLEKTPAADLWRHLVAIDTSFFTSSLAEELRDEGRVEGKAQGVAESLLLVLAGRDIEVSEEARERITTCDDHDVLTTWLTRAMRAASTAEVFADVTE